MDRTIFVAMYSNAALLLVLSVIYEVTYFIPSRYRRIKPIFDGLLIALICTAIMNMPLILQPGIVFDTRSILISVTGLFFGLIPTIITVAVASFIRVGIGGVGTMTGLAVIMTSAIIGLAWRQWLYPKETKWRWLSVYAMSGIVHVAMLAFMLLLPSPEDLNTIREIALPIMVIYPIASVLLSLLLMRQQDLRSTQAAERKANKDYQLLFREMVDGFALHEIICDEEGMPIDYRFLAINPAFERMTGLKQEDIVGRTVMEVLPDTEPFWIETFGRVVLTGKPVVFTNFAIALKKHFKVSAYPSSSNQFAVTFSDITEQIEAKEREMESLSRLKGLLDNSPSPIVIIDEHGRFVEVSAVAEKIMGLPKEEIYMKEVAQVAPPDMAKKALYVLSQSSDDGQFLENIDVFEFDGNKRYFESRVFPIHVPDQNTELFGYLGIDITDRIVAEHALKENEEKHTSYIENAPYGVFVTDENGQYVEANISASSITGYSREELLKMSLQDITAEEFMESALQHFEKLESLGHMNGEFKYIHKNGSLRWWSVNSVKLSENRYLGFCNDITEKKDAEANLIYLINHDHLTGLYNRKFYEAELKRVDIESELPLSIIVADINGLKLINDSFGDSEGDKIIIEAAKLLSRCCRQGDILFRIGGDEFKIILPKTNIESAMKQLESIHAACEQYNLNTVNEAYHINLSLGTATKDNVKTDFAEVSIRAEDYMNQRKLLEKNSSYSGIISAIKATMLEKSNETELHAERIAQLSRKVGIVFNLSQIELDQIELLATLHDIGKVGIPERIVKKPGNLNHDEWVQMKKHPEIGYRIAMSSPNLAPIANYILCHHERWDGNGYPRNLKGTEIPLISRIIAVVDAYDAMTEDRVYRKAMTYEAAIEEIVKCAGTQFDPEVAKIFVEVISDKEVFI